MSGRGALTITTSALGIALVAAGGLAAVDRPEDRPPPRSDVAAATVPAFVVEPPVRIRRAERRGAATQPARATRGTRAAPASGRPLRLAVPVLGVDVPVVGIDAAGGVLRPPDDPQVLGWWRSGAVPGRARGSALVTGHTVSSGGGAFDDLETLRPGDVVRVRTTKGFLGYEVARVRTFGKAQLARRARRVFSQSVPGRLVLITCEDWDGTAYRSNVVVVATPTRGRSNAP